MGTDEQVPTSPSSPLLPPRPATKASSFIEEEPTRPPPLLPPRRADQIPERKPERAMVADLVPDLHGLIPTHSLRTELDTFDANLTKATINAAEQKSIPATVNIPGAFQSNPKHLIPDWYRTGWTSMTSGENPGGSLNIPATISRHHNDFLDEILPDYLYGAWYHNGAALFLTAVISWILAKSNAGLGSVLLFCLFIGNIYKKITHNIY